MGDFADLIQLIYFYNNQLVMQLRYELTYQFMRADQNLCLNAYMYRKGEKLHKIGILGLSGET